MKKFKGESSELIERNEIVNLDIMTLIDSRKLSRIKRDFMACSGKLTKKEFILIMLHHLPKIKDQIRLVGSLNELFEQIDVNHDQVLEWEEFSNHIIERGMIRKERAFIETIKQYQQFYWPDKGKHKTEIENMFFLPVIKQLIVVEANCKQFKVYDMKKMRYVGEVSGHRGCVLAATHAPSMKYVVTSGTDLTILLWDEYTYVLKQRISSPVIPLCLVWDRVNQTLYSSGTDTIIYAWDLKTCCEKSAIKNWNPFADLTEDQSGHRSIIISLLVIEEMSMLVSGDMYGKIFLWDIPQSTIRRKLKGQEKGVYYLDWHPEFQLIFSAGLDRDAYVWNPYVKKEIFKLTGHNHSLIGVKCIPGTYQIITGDISGLFRVWDIRTLATVQVFSSTGNEINSFEVTYPEKKVLFGSKSILVYKYDEPRDQKLADEDHTVCTLYNSLFQNFITVHPKRIKIWSAKTGQLQNVFRDITKSEISSAVLDHRQRKLYIGNSKGKVYSLNIKNGQRIKKFTGHQDEITQIVYWEQQRLVISSSWDGQVVVHDDSITETASSKKSGKITHKCKVSCVAMHNLTETLASGSEDGIIMITKLLNYRIEATIPAHPEEITSMIFLNPTNMLVTADLLGNVRFWVIQANHTKRKPVVSITNGDTENPSSVSCMDYDHQNKYLFTGDEQGTLRVYDLTRFLNKVDASPLGLINLHENEEFNYNSNLFLTTKTILNRNLSDPDNRFSSEDFKEVLDLKVHKDLVTHLSLIKSTGLIVTCSFDRNVYIWDLQGHKKGSLVISGDSNFDIQMDFEAISREDWQVACELYQEIKNMNYENLIATKESLRQPSSDEEAFDETEINLKEFYIPKRLATSRSEAKISNLGQSRTLKKIDTLPSLKLNLKKDSTFKSTAFSMMKSKTKK